MNKVLTAILGSIGKGTGLVLKGVSGPLGWAASLFVDKLLKIGIEAGKKGIQNLITKWKLRKQKKADDQRVDDYNKTLQDGAKEKEQIDASLDVLNSTDRRDH